MEVSHMWVDKDGDLSFLITVSGVTFVHVYLTPAGEWHAYYTADSRKLASADVPKVRALCAAYLIQWLLVNG